MVRRALIILPLIAVLTLATAGLAAAKQDMDPYVFGIETATVTDGEIVVTGPCEVQFPPQTVDVRVHVAGERGARAHGSSTQVCDGPDSGDTFEVTATMRGAHGFEAGDTVSICAKAHAHRSGGWDAIAHWCKDVPLS